MVGAACGLVATIPLWVPIAVAVRLSSPGPVLHRATRVGRGGEPFTLLKFRSMRVGPSGPAVTGARDPRITAVGRVIRRTKLDELPQLLNVLRGDMSLVGPRPEDPRYVAHYAPDERVVLAVRPGITGAASVEYRDEEQILADADDVEAAYLSMVLPAKLAIELKYVGERSVRGDLALLWATAVAVVRSR